MIFKAPLARESRGRGSCVGPSEAAARKIFAQAEAALELSRACLVGCGVTTGWGSAVNTAGVQPGDTVVGIGGVGSGALQGARIAGAEKIIAVDLVPDKRRSAELFGATHSPRASRRPRSSSAS